MRVRFQKGFQRKFLDSVIVNTKSPSLRGLIQFGIGTNYQTLKSYYNESRTLPKKLFEVLCVLGKIDSSNLEVDFITRHWGQQLGGRR